MNKFEPPLGGKSVDPEDGVHRGSEQARAGQPAPASFSGGEPAPPKPNYGTFFTVYPSDRRQSEAWAGAFIGILVGVFLAALGVLARDVVFAVASIMFAATFVAGAAVDAGWSRGLVRVDMAPDGCVTVRPSVRLTVLRIVTVVCAGLGFVLYGLSLLVGVSSLLVRLGGDDLLRARRACGGGWPFLVLVPAAGVHRAHRECRHAVR